MIKRCLRFLTPHVPTNQGSSFDRVPRWCSSRWRKRKRLHWSQLLKSCRNALLITSIICLTRYLGSRWSSLILKVEFFHLYLGWRGICACGCIWFFRGQGPRKVNLRALGGMATYGNMFHHFLSQLVLWSCGHEFPGVDSQGDDAGWLCGSERRCGSSNVKVSGLATKLRWLCTGWLSMRCRIWEKMIQGGWCCPCFWKQVPFRYHRLND